jgi:hypothetical protein
MTITNNSSKLEKLNNPKKCDKCLDYFDQHKCFRCQNTYCGCDGGSYYMVVGPSEYTCTPCFDKHEEKYSNSTAYKICHDGPLWIGGIVGVTVNVLCWGYFLLCGIQYLLETYSLIILLLGGSLLFYVIRKLVIYCKKDNELRKRQYEEFLKQQPNETASEHKHRINHDRWDREIWNSGI